MKEKFIPSLTPLRGIAALTLVLFHAHLLMARLADNHQTLFFSKLYLMVDFFFVLSGFILYHVYGHYFTNTVTRSSYSKYILARFARIYPLHFFMLLVVIGLYMVMLANKIPMQGVLARIFDPTALPSNITLLHAVIGFDEATWNTPSWSISVEWVTYLFFPFIMRYLISGSAAYKWMMAIFVLVGNLAVMYYFQPALLTRRMEWLGKIPGFEPHWNTIDVITGPALIRCLCSFTAGLLAYELYKREWNKKLLSSGLWFVLGWLILIIGWHFDQLPDAITPFIFASIILVAANNNGKLKTILNIAPLTWLGNISYSLYMVHMPIVFSFLVAKMINPAPADTGPIPFSTAWMIAFILMALSILLATITYYFIEKPMRGWIKKASLKLARVFAR